MILLSSLFTFTGLGSLLLTSRGLMADVLVFLFLLILSAIVIISVTGRSSVFKVKSLGLAKVNREGNYFSNPN